MVHRSRQLLPHRFSPACVQTRSRQLPEIMPAEHNPPCAARGTSTEHGLMTPTRNLTDKLNILPNTHKDEDFAEHTQGQGLGQQLARRRARPSSRTRKKTGGLRLRRTGGSGILTSELGEQAPAPVAVGLDVVDEELVLLRRPGPLLEPLGPVAARRPPHRPPASGRRRTARAPSPLSLPHARAR